jgi:hypothetical protein
VADGAHEHGTAGSNAGKSLGCLVGFLLLTGDEIPIEIVPIILAHRTGVEGFVAAADDAISNGFTRFQFK